MSRKEDVFLEEARLGPRERVLVECEEIPHLPRLKRRFTEYVLTDIAHAVMLTETGIITAERGARLLGGLLEMLDSEGADFPYLPDVGSFLVQTEHRLGERIGEDVAGRLQTGRSRNDQSAAAERLYVRDLLLDATGELVAVQRAVLAQAEQHADTLMPGYTHLQHAQPSTFGHHMMRYAAAFDRDLTRLRQTFERANLSSLGGAAMAGTSWPVDRERTAALLGHDGVVVNSSDAGGFARDYIEESVATLSVLMSNLGRLANDLYVWHSWEFGYVEVADGLAGTSSIMPQKKNPHSLERIKSLAGQASGWLPGVMACQHSVFSTDLDFTFADDTLTQMGDATLQALRLAEVTIDTITVHAERMADAAGAFWSTTSHLADELVRRYDLPFRAAHHVVGRFVRDSLAAGMTPADVKGADLTKAGREMADTEINIGDDDLRDILDARSFLTSRATLGSVHPEQTRAHHADLLRGLDDHHQWHKKRRVDISAAVNDMIAHARTLARG